MSYFLRRYNIMLSLKTGKEKEVLPLCKAIAPVLSFHPAVRKLHTESIAVNMKFSSQDSKPDEKGKPKRPLAVILSWLMAKDQHIDKYRSLYLNKGFDVLTVNIAPKDLLFPVSGSQVVATNVLEYLKSHIAYDDIVFHAFSVGGYLLGEMFVKIRDDSDDYKSIVPRIKGVVLDSVVDVEGLPAGFPKAITKNPITFKVLQWYTTTHLALMYNVATKHYLKSSKHFHNTPLRCPALIFTSEADKVGSPAQNQLARENWMNQGIDVDFKCFKDSKHVSHMYKYPEEYISTLDCFLNKINTFPNKT